MTLDHLVILSICLLIRLFDSLSAIALFLLKKFHRKHIFGIKKCKYENKSAEKDVNIGQFY